MTLRIRCVLHGRKTDEVALSTSHSSTTSAIVQIRECASPPVQMGLSVYFRLLTDESAPQSFSV
jgi:hypothetical protein